MPARCRSGFDRGGTERIAGRAPGLTVLALSRAEATGLVISRVVRSIATNRSRRGPPRRDRGKGSIGMKPGGHARHCPWGWLRCGRRRRSRWSDTRTSSRDTAERLSGERRSAARRATRGPDPATSPSTPRSTDALLPAARPAGTGAGDWSDPSNRGLLLGECSGPAYRMETMSSSCPFTMS
jgi:hypothetical protein